MKNIALIPGSFNPIHMGHIDLATTALDTYQFDEVRFIPAFQNPFKQPHALSFDQRCELIKLQIDSDDTWEHVRSKNWYEKDVSVWTVEEEVQKNKKSTEECLYFYEVAEWIQHLDEYHKNHFVLVFGEDILMEFSFWKNPRIISSIFDILFMSRTLKTSSTAIRETIKKGNQSDMIASEVHNKIIEWKAYTQ